MKKIGLITIHDTLNYGSLLQTYALYKAIESLGVEIELIDYKCKAIMDRETTYPLSQCRNIKDTIKSLMWHKAMQKKYENFWSFIKDNMKITKPYTRENVKELNDIFDVFIVGSDIVWGTNITGNDWTYFLDFADDSKTKIAFSSSVGTKWNSNVEKQILSNLNKFKSISVREELAQSWLREIGINADVTCDPTMLWDAMERHHQFIYNNILKQLNLSRNKSSPNVFSVTQNSIHRILRIHCIRIIQKNLHM